MKYVNFESVEAQNFLSIGKESVSVDFTSGLHIITGINRDKEDRRNGVGKSTIADAIHFAIFGTTIRDLKKENIVNHITNENCKVTLKFNITESDSVISYKIVRSIEPSFCKLYVDDTDKTLDSIPSTNEYIEKILNINQDIFQNCIIMTLNNTVPFMGKKKVEKRKFIEGIFNLSVFSEMLSNLREEYNNIKRDFELSNSKLEDCSKNVSIYKNQFNQFEKTKNDEKVVQNNRRINNLNKISNLRSNFKPVSVEEINKIKESVSENESNIKKCEDKYIKIQGEIAALETEKRIKLETCSKIGTSLSTCPVCLKSVTDHDNQHIDSEKMKIQICVDVINTNVQKKSGTGKDLNSLKGILKKKLSDNNTELNGLNLKNKENENLEQNIKDLEKLICDIDEDIIKITNSENQFGKLLKDEEGKHAELEKKSTDLKTNINTLDTVKFVVSEEGVKSFIVKKILQHFNSKINFYLSKMDANCMCMFNEYFEEEIVDEKGKICSYNNFSGAERKNIDLACLFAFMDIRRMQGCVVYNMSIYDELFDSSLDEKGVELVVDILKERVTALNECIMVISHRKESAKAATGDIIFLEKSRGITRRVAPEVILAN